MADLSIAAIHLLRTLSKQREGGAALIPRNSENMRAAFEELKANGLAEEKVGWSVTQAGLQHPLTFK